MQIRTGSASVTNASATIVASDGNDWTAATVGSLFSVPGDGGVLYTIGAITGPGLSDSGFWELEISAPYAGATNAAAAYAITKDFTPAYGFPLIYRGDTDTAALINRLAILLDGQLFAAIVEGAGGPPFLGTFDDYKGVGGTFHSSAPTVGLTTGKLYCWNHSTEGVKFGLLNAGNDADVLPGKYRPNDYNGVTNQKFWTLR